MTTEQIVAWVKTQPEGADLPAVVPGCLLRLIGRLLDERNEARVYSQLARRHR